VVARDTRQKPFGPPVCVCVCVQSPVTDPMANPFVIVSPLKHDNSQKWDKKERKACRHSSSSYNSPFVYPFPSWNWEKRKNNKQKTLGSIVREVNIIDPDPPLPLASSLFLFFFAKNEIWKIKEKAKTELMWRAWWWIKVLSRKSDESNESAAEYGGWLGIDFLLNCTCLLLPD